LASLGFEFIEWLPTEGVTLPNWRGKTSLMKKIFPPYINMMNRTPLGRFSYTMFFLFKKVKTVIIEQDM